ncbi:riboflavin transporter MCH5 [Aspergillus udagawae]|uniref:Riboflavin transporter MCH5 n=1 Tax=Aspergillus udagawae TaxID=91492 RepID=A0ABQ1B7V0_9EURO|nr:riboflavin transporter MCH5 [Aspergillus udagawae]
MVSQPAIQDIPRQDVPGEETLPMSPDSDDSPKEVGEKLTTPPSAPSGPPSPPSGGLTAWLQVAAGFVLFFNTWGMINALLFRDLLDRLHPMLPPSADRADCRPHLRPRPPPPAPHDWQFPGRLRCSSLGGIIYPIVLYRLLGPIGFPWAVRTLGFIALGTFILPLAVMRMRIRAPKPRAVVDWSAFTDVPFMVFTLSVVILFIGNAVLIFYISFYPENRGFTDTSLAFYMAAIFNAGSFFGRIAPNALSDRIGVFNTMAPITLLLGVTVLCMLGVHNEAGMIVEAVVTGFFSGVVVALPPVCFRVLTANKSMIGTRIGQGFAIGGLGLLIGGPSGGAILGKKEPLDWTGLWVYGGLAGCVAGIILVGVRIMKAGVSLKVKA